MLPYLRLLDEVIHTVSALSHCTSTLSFLPHKTANMEDAAKLAELKKKRTFRKFSYRGVDLDQLLDLSADQLMQLVHARAQRRFSRGLKRKPLALMKKLRKAKKEAPALEKPAVVKTHLRNMIVLPDMIGSIVGVHNGKVFNQVEIKPEMVGHYLVNSPSHTSQFATVGQVLVLPIPQDLYH